MSKVLKVFSKGLRKIQRLKRYSKTKHNRLIRMRMTRWLSNFDKQAELFKTMPLFELKSKSLFWGVGAYYLAGYEGITAEQKAVREMLKSIDAAQGFLGMQKEEQERFLILGSFLPRTRVIVEKMHKELSLVK